jgi:DNA-binding NtrC family response regulator
MLFMVKMETSNEARSTMGHRVLVVEDNPRWQDHIVELLSEVSCDPIRASTFEDAIEKLDSVDNPPIDLVIIDINLTDVIGNKDGEITKPALPTIVVSGTIPASSRSLTDQLVAFFEKSTLDVDDFLDAVVRALSSQS